MRRALLAAIGVWASLSACDPSTGAKPREGSGASTFQASERDVILARVDDGVVTLREAREVSAATSLSLREATERLIEERLLAAEAERRAYGDHARVGRATSRAAVQQLLARRVEAEETLDQLPEEVVREQIDAARDGAGAAAPAPEIESRVRRRLLRERRRERLDTLLEQLARRFAVERDQAEVERALTSVQVWQ